MKTIIVTVAALMLGAWVLPAIADARPRYSGSKHSYSHGGNYSGGRGSSHKGGSYKNWKTSNRYGRHR
jgi:hypothetical protein